MPRPRKLTEGFLAECEEEAQRRAGGVTNKELARRGGVSPSYVAQLIARMARALRKHQLVEVSTETPPES